MKRFATAVVAAALIAAGFIPGFAPEAAQAAPFFSWENANEGWSHITGFSDTTGVTDGTYSGVYDAPNGFSWGFRTGNWNPVWAALNPAQKTNTTILVDITAEAGGTGEGDVLVNPWIWWSDGATTGNGGLPAQVVPQDGVTRTYAFDYAAAGLGGTASIDWTQLRLPTWGSDTLDPGNVYFDNLRLVPEPASLALLGVGGLLLARRRR